MKALCAAAAVGLALIGAASAQPYGGPDGYGYRDRGYDYRDRGYDRGYGDDYDRRGPRFGGGGRGGFDEREYVRCNPDVRRALQRGQLTSAYDHYRVFGRREGRRLSC